MQKGMFFNMQTFLCFFPILAVLLFFLYEYMHGTELPPPVQTSGDYPVAITNMHKK